MKTIIVLTGSSDSARDELQRMKQSHPSVSVEATLMTGNFLD